MEAVWSAGGDIERHRSVEAEYSTGSDAEACGHQRATRSHVKFEVTG